MKHKTMWHKTASNRPQSVSGGGKKYYEKINLLFFNLYLFCFLF
jgi:hypothetical protein